MSAVRAYARGRMSECGYSEWADGFNFENVPRTLQNRVYILELGQATTQTQHQDNTTVTVPLRVRVLLAGFRDPKTRIDQAIALTDPIIAEFTDPINRLTQGAVNNEKILNVTFQARDVEPYGDTNDNLMHLNVSFLFTLIRSTRGS